MVSFVYLSVESLFDKFYGVNCRPKLGAKLLDRFFHRWRQVSPPVNSLTHRFFDGSHHLLYRNFTVGSRHGVVASSSSMLPEHKPERRGREMIDLLAVEESKPKPAKIRAGVVRKLATRTSRAALPHAIPLEPEGR